MTYHVGDSVRTPTGIVGRVDGFHGGTVIVSWGAPYTEGGRQSTTFAACHLAPATPEEARQAAREEAR